MNWNDRIAAYAKTTGFPSCMTVGPDGVVYGMWVMGNDYRSKQGYHGEYPASYLKRVRALFHDRTHALHVFSGKVDLEAFPGHTVDLNPDLNPDFIDDAQTLLTVPLDLYDIILLDPPYSEEDADKYGTTMVKRNKVMDALGRCASGTYVCVLDQALWMYSKTLWSVEARIGIVRSTNHRFRCLTVFKRKDKSS